MHNESPELIRLRQIVKIWRDRIAFRYRSHNPEETPLEIYHTCHGCGNGPCHPTNGLCDSCRLMIGEIPFEPCSGIVGTTENIHPLVLASQPIITELPKLIVPAGYDREAAVEKFMLCFFAYQEMGMTIPHVSPEILDPNQLQPLQRVAVYDKDLFGGERRREGLLCWVRGDLCGVLFDDSGEEETHKTCDVHDVPEPV